MAGAVVVVDVVVVKSRNLPLLTLSRYQSAWVFPLKKYCFNRWWKKSIFWCFFSAYVCMELKVGFRKLRKKWGSSKDLISPSPLLLFLCFKKLRTTWTNIILTNSNIYLVWTGYFHDIFRENDFTKFFVKMISRNFRWNWVSSCCCFAGSASFECL